MLITKKVNIIINTSNINYYINIGYENIKRKDIIKIPVDHLSKGSNIKVDAKCDICGCEKNILYFRYLENIIYFFVVENVQILKDKKLI